MAEKVNKTQKFISPTEAVIVARELGVRVSYPTVIKWVEMNELGHQVGGKEGKGGKWIINQNKWRNYLNGPNKKS